MLKLIEGEKSKVVVDEQNTEGLMEFSVNHEIKESKAYINYVGPKIPKEEWEKILSFFKWTYDTYKSESQARLFVNTELQTWKAWVFPQEADTGMSAREMDCDDHRKQRIEQFGDPYWTLFGTVHHHCSCTAFQSGTDKANEQNQDGLHITIGKMDEKVYDIHARFYRKKWCLDTGLDLSDFWDIGGVIATIPEFARKFVPSDLPNKLAREQMCVPSTIEFPEQWKQNVITKPKSEIVVPSYGHVTGNGRNTQVVGSYSYSGEYEPVWKRAQNAWGDIVDECATHRVDRKAMAKAVDKLMSENSPVSIIAYALHRHKINIDQLFEEMRKGANGIDAPATGGVSKDVMDIDQLAEDQWREFCGQ